jgi:DNA-binding NarL/FixJ family response regulator
MDCLDITCYRHLNIINSSTILAFPSVFLSRPATRYVEPWRTNMRPTSQSSIGVLIADDSAAICRLIAHLLQIERSIHIVGVAGTLEKAVHLAVKYSPDVLLLDLHLDDLAGHDPLSVKIGFFTCVRHVIAMSTRTDEEERQFAQVYGSPGLVDKFALAEQLVPAIQACAYPNHHTAPRPPRRPASLSRYVS